MLAAEPDDEVPAAAVPVLIIGPGIDLIIGLAGELAAKIGQGPQSDLLHQRDLLFGNHDPFFQTGQGIRNDQRGAYVFIPYDIAFDSVLEGRQRLLQGI